MALFEAHRLRKIGSLRGLVLGLAIVLTTGSVAQAQTPPPSIQQGYTLLNRGWVNDAIAAFRRAVQRYPQSVEAKLGLALAYQRAGQDANAWQTYRQVVAQDPNNRRALLAIGTLGGYRAEWQPGGIAALTTLLNLDTTNTAARTQRALLYGYQSQFAAALADYQVLLRSNPTPDAILGAAQIYTYSGDYAQGLSLFDRYLSTSRTIPNSAITAYALGLRETGKVTQAIEVLSSRLQSLRTLDETAIQIRSALSIAYQANQQPNEALAVLAPLQNRLEATLALARALSSIARLSGNAPQYDEAVSLYRQMLRAPNPSVGLVSEAADVFSESPAAQTEALQLYDQLTAQQPQPSLQVKRLVLARQLGRISPAEFQQQLQTAIEPLPADLTEQRSIAQALLRLDAPDPQLLPIYQTLASRVELPFLSFRIAQILVQQGNLTAARSALATYTATAVGAQDTAPAFLLAEIDRRAGNLDSSAQRYEAIIARNPNPATLKNAQRGLAGIRLAQGRTADALALYDQIAAANPTDRTIQLGRASIAYQADGQSPVGDHRLSLAEATTVLSQWLTDQPTATPPELFSLVGALPPDSQRLPLYDRLLAIDPNNIPVNLRWVQVWAARDPAQAQARVEQLIARNPDNINVYFVQGELAQSTGNLVLASQAYRAILDKQPNNADALSALGGVRFQQRQFAAATQLYSRVLALRPGNREAQRILAELQAAQDRPLAALQALRRIPNPDDAVVDRIRRLQIDLLRRRGFQPSWERY